MLNFRNTLMTLAFAAASGFYACQDSNSVAGTEIPNGSGKMVEGRLLDAQNKPVSGAVVSAVPVNYVPSLGLSKRASFILDTTDANGYYHIFIDVAGLYNLNCIKDSLGAFIDSILVHDSGSVEIPNFTLRHLGVIKGTSYMPGQSDTNQVRVTLYMPGTNRITKPVIGGAFAFDNVPAGHYQIIIDPTLNNYDVKVLDTTLAAGDTLDLGEVELNLHQADTVDITNGSVSGTWKPGIVYRVFNDVEVPTGATLTVLPGAKVLFMGDFALNVYGNLISNGNPDSLILYSAAFSQWTGIEFLDSVSSETSSLSYSIIEKASFGLQTYDGVHGPLAPISHCVFRYCSVGTSAENTYNDDIFHDNTYAMLFNTFATDTARVLLANSIVIRSADAVVRVGCISKIPQCATVATHIPVNLGLNFFGADTQFVFAKNAGTTYQNFGPLILDTTVSVTPSSADPGFISLTRGSEDYHLQPTSPCKGTGTGGTDMGIYSTY